MNLHCKGIFAKGFRCLGPSSEVSSLSWSTVNKKDFIEESVFDLLIPPKPRIEPCYAIYNFHSTICRPVITSWDPCSPHCQLWEGSPSPHRRLGRSWHMGHKFPQHTAYLLCFNFHFSHKIFCSVWKVCICYSWIVPSFTILTHDRHLWHHTRFVTAFIPQRFWDLVKVHFLLPVIWVPGLYD